MIWNLFRRKPKEPHGSGVYPFRPLIEALKAKDGDLYSKICHLSPSEFRVEWQKVHPEDFPQGGDSPPTPRSVILP